MCFTHLTQSLVSQISGLRFDVGAFVKFDVSGVKVTLQFLGNRLAVLLPLIGFFLNAVMHMEGVHIVGPMRLNGGVKQDGGIKTPTKSNRQDAWRCFSVSWLICFGCCL